MTQSRIISDEKYIFDFAVFIKYPLHVGTAFS
jgi:hypothetical protein